MFFKSKKIKLLNARTDALLAIKDGIVYAVQSSLEFFEIDLPLNTTQLDYVATGYVALLGSAFKNDSIIGENICLVCSTKKDPIAYEPFFEQYRYYYNQAQSILQTVALKGNDTETLGIFIHELASHFLDELNLKKTPDSIGRMSAMFTNVINNVIEIR